MFGIFLYNVTVTCQPFFPTCVRLDAAVPLGLTFWKVGEQIYCTVKAGSSFNGNESVTATNSIMKINLFAAADKERNEKLFSLSYSYFAITQCNIRTMWHSILLSCSCVCLTEPEMSAACFCSSFQVITETIYGEAVKRERCIQATTSGWCRLSPSLPDCVSVAAPLRHEHLSSASDASPCGG